MEIVKADNQGLKEAAAVLRKGGVVVYPTDTAYALGGFYDSPRVIKKILKIKNRQDKKFTIICSSLNQAEKFFKLTAVQKKFVKKYWPGPLSLVVSDIQSVRVPKNKIAGSLARRAGKPLIATSANISGDGEIYDSKEIIKLFSDKKNQPNLIIDGGKLKKIKPSTIVKINEGSAEVLRQGAIKI